MVKKNKVIKIIAVVSLFGLLISLYSWLHNQGFAQGEFCKLDDVFDCDVVNKGPFSKIMGIPVSLIGILGYGFLFAGSIVKIKNMEDYQLTLFLLLASIGGFTFSLYLTALEAFVLKAWCLLCLTSQFIIFATTVLLLRMFLEEHKKVEK